MSESDRTSPDDVSVEELQLATRNHGTPLEALAYPVTPVGLHYLLIHYDIPRVDARNWTLDVGGSVGQPLSLSLDDIRARPAVTVPITMECAGNGRALLAPRPVSQPWLIEAVGTAEWTGAPLAELLEQSGLLDETVEILFTGLDRGYEGGIEQCYQRSLPLAVALAGDALLAYEMNGEDLPPQHGAPLRLMVPGWYGMTNVKWLSGITALKEPFDGYQQTEAYRVHASDDDPGEPVTRIMPRALMVPPGVPDFMSRERFVELGPCVIDGRAWSGWGAIERVEVSADGGHTWGAARIGEQLSNSAWYSWSYVWEPNGPGTYELCCRALDSAGNQQPSSTRWNTKGYVNNEVQRVPVTVTSQPAEVQT